MIAGLDSSQSRPTLVIAAQARAGAIGLWSGYLATKGGVNLLSPWDLASFDVARQLGGTPIAFCSGWDDPVACRNLATQWNVRLCLDVETGIRSDGNWVQQWLDLSGAGLYGQHYQDTNSNWHSIHLNRTAAFHVMSWYIGRDPGATWAGPQPSDGSPLGWQWQGDHQEFGLSVDRGTYDDWFGGAFSQSVIGGAPLTQAVKLAFVRLAYNAYLWRVPSVDEENSWASQILDDGSNLDAVEASIEDSAEGNTVKAARAKLLQYANANSFPGSPAAPHTHPFTGTTGSS
jgi:hypothetical protein